MFDLDNHDEIVRMISCRKEGSFVVPLYVNHFHELYDIRDLGSIQNFNSGNVTVGFGAINGLFQKYQFPMSYALEFNVRTVFDIPYERVEGVMTKYIVFESSIIDDDRFDAKHPMIDQVNYYCGIIRNRLLEQYKIALAARRAELVKVAQEQEE